MLTATPEAAASQVAQQIGNLANALAKQHVTFKANGRAAVGNSPGFTSAQYTDAVTAMLGANGMSILDTMAAANPQS